MPTLIHRDCLGNPLSTTDPAAVAQIDGFIAGYLGNRASMARLAATVDDYPTEPLLNAYAAMLWMFLEAPEAPAKAAPYLARATAARAGATVREALAIDMAAAWQAADWDELQALGNAALAQFPADAVLGKLHIYHCFNRGDGPAMLRAAKTIVAALPQNPHVLALLAFGHEQCHDIREAEAAARQALAIDPAEPWAQHAIAHICLSEGRIREGRDFLAARTGDWTGLNSFMVTHLWWHLALFLISDGALEDALTLYDTQVWGVEKSYSQDQIGAVSLLARLEWAGADVGPRWQELATWLLARTSDTVQPFLSLQYLLGLALAGRPESRSLMAAIEAEAAQVQALPVWRTVALPVAEAILAFAGGEYARCADLLRPALPHIASVGGSHAQRDLFEQLLLEALLRAGNWRDARQMIDARLALDVDSLPLAAKRAACENGVYTPHSGEGMAR